MKKGETSEQIAVVDYCGLAGIPVIHIPNEGNRSVWYASLLKRMGLKSGFPDLFITRARGGYHGLFIEMKFGRGKTTDKQEEWLRLLTKEGYACTVCYSADDAIKIIKFYNNL